LHIYKNKTHTHTHTHMIVMMVGIEYSGKTMFRDCTFDGRVSDYLATTGYAETDISYRHKKILLVEYGGTVSPCWHHLFKHYRHRKEITCMMLFVDGSFDEAQLERTRCHLMCLYYYFEELRTKPLCVVQHNASADEAPTLEWDTVKEILQLESLVRSKLCNNNIIMVRLVYDEPKALQKNINRILDWIIK